MVSIADDGSDVAVFVIELAGRRTRLRYTVIEGWDSCDVDMHRTQACSTSALLHLQVPRVALKRGSVRGRSVSAALDVQLHLAASSDRLDLSESELQDVPFEIFDLENLTELSLAGNGLSRLPVEISRLSRLQKLQLAGNALEQLPDEIGALTDLKGLWAHGNFLASLPESFGNLKALQKCSLSGNRLQSLPSTLSQVTGLIELEAAGNQLRELPCLEGLQQLQKLTLHGNRLVEITESILFCLHLQNLALQGNAIQQISSPYFFFPQGLKSLNVADNQLRYFACDVGNLTNLEHLTLYGNRLETLPAALMDLPNLKSVWLEGNPLDAATLENVTAKRPIKVGLDQRQQASLGRSLSENSMVSFSRVPDVYQKGYFKLIRAQQDQASDMVVIAFGSAPGTPNWGSVLRRVMEKSRTRAVTKTYASQSSKITDGQQQKEQERPELIFDVLFVVDPSRSWYGVGDDDFKRYAAALQDICATYRHRVMIGDSMGASAALLFSDLATAVLSFCPQIDLSSSSIRPANSPHQWAALKQQIQERVDKTSATIQVITGTWSHDIAQVRHLNRDKIQHSVIHMDTHRLTAYLARSQELVPLIQRALEEMAETAC